MMRAADPSIKGVRLRALIVVLWRPGLRIAEALALAESDLEPQRGALLVRSGKGGKRREVGVDDWGWEQLRSWLGRRIELPVGPLFCVVQGPTTGAPWASTTARVQLRQVPRAAVSRTRSGFVRGPRAATRRATT